VKLHGGLYHQVGRDRGLAVAVAEMLADRWPRLVVYAAAGSLLVSVARARGLAVAEEAFVDRGYAADGTLVPRGRPGAAVDEPAEAASRALRVVRDGLITTVVGGDIRVAADTLCIHGDGPRAVELATAVREALLAAGVAIHAATGRARPT
jgi:UPF0271 protein